MSITTAWTDEHFIGGDAALDFANTVYRRTPEVGTDLLNTPEALTTWLTRAQLLPATEEPENPFTHADAALTEARALRELFWEVFDTQNGGHELPEGSLARLLDIARSGISDLTVQHDGTTTPRNAHGVFAVLALRGIKLALSPPPQPVRACDDCGWFFIDTSKGRRRRWCSMKTCGNRAKAARFRAEEK